MSLDNKPNNIVAQAGNAICLSHVMIIFAACHKPIIRKNVFLQIIPAWRKALRAWETEHGEACVITIFSNGRHRRIKALPYDIAQRFADEVIPEAIANVRQNASALMEAFSLMDQQKHAGPPIEDEDEKTYEDYVKI